MSANAPSCSPLGADEAECLRRNWGLLLAVGVLMAAVGCLAIGYPVAATLTTVELFGILLMIGGAVQLLGAFRAGTGGGFAAHLLCGFLALFLGAALIDRPLLGAAGYTLVMAIFFFASGLVRVVFALTRRFPGRGWVLLNGAVTLLLGVLIWRDLPEAALWVIGTFVGIDLVFNGLSWVMLALAGRTAGRAVAPAAPAGPALARA